MRAESAVEPTRSEKHHRDLAAFGALSGAGTVRRVDVAATSTDGAMPLVLVRRCSNCIEQCMRRCPSDGHAKSFKSSAVRFRRTRPSMAFSRNDRLILSEAQAPQPDHDVHTAPTIGVGAYHLLRQRRCLGQIGLWVSQRFTKTAAVVLPPEVFIGAVKIPDWP